MTAMRIAQPQVASTADRPFTVLLVEPDAAHARRVKASLMAVGEGAFRVAWVTRVSAALARLATGDVEVVLIGAKLPDCDEKAAFAEIRQASTEALILPLIHAGVEIGGSHDPAAGGNGSAAESPSGDASWLADVLRYVSRCEQDMSALRRDIRQARAMTRKMTHLAQHDVLTGLSNRMLLNERVTQSISLARRHGKHMALLFVDLDRFKEINDALGHAIGDRVLQAVADGLAHCVRATDTVCRQGGDEFVVLLSEIEKREDAAQVAEKLLAAFAEPLRIDGHALRIEMSIGISVYPQDGDGVDVMIRHADAAMYHAKANGPNNYGFFTADKENRSARSKPLETHLDRAVEKGEFLLHYQPQIEMATGRVIGVEALVRWLDPHQGVVYPGQFVPIAEQSGLIVPIGHWVLLQACRQIAAWQASGLVALPVAVNVSAVEFRDPGFIESVTETLRETRLDSGSLELELTESVLMEDTGRSITTLKALQAIGVRIAIDDFGTGFSSLSYLRRFPIDTIKIDGSFMLDVGSEPDNETIVRAIISLGKSLRHRVVAEGVETAQQHAFLQAQHCDVGQGFHWSRPMPAEEVLPQLAGPLNRRAQGRPGEKP